MNNKLIPFLVSAIILPLFISGCSNVLERKIEDNVYLEDKNVGGLTESQIKKIIENYSKKVNVEAKKADWDKEKMEIIPEKTGQRINAAKTLEALMNSKKGKSIKLIIEEVKPQITSETISKDIVEIGRFSTTLLDRQRNRRDNIEVATDCINNTLLMPKEEFSFNEVLGRRTKAKGYKKAPIIIKTEEGPKKGYGVGGGICQVSSTLFNAVEKAGLEITERHMHSKGVGYVPKGRDATVVFDSLDFKFRNNRQYPVIIKINLSKNKLMVTILENRNQVL